MPSITDTTQGKLATAITSTIEGLSLTGITDANIVYRNPPHVGALTFPAIVISDYQEELIQSLNDQDDTIYVFQVAVIQGSQSEASSSQINRLQWRETIRTAFHNQRSWSVSQLGTSMLICEVRPGATFDPQARRDGYEAQYLFLRCRVRENR